jgi:hypothetical protein
VDVQIDVFLTSALVGDEWSATHLCRITPEEGAPDTHRLGGWVHPRAGLNDIKCKHLTIPGLELRPLARPARNQLLYHLRYSGSLMSWTARNICLGPLMRFDATTDWPTDHWSLRDLTCIHSLRGVVIDILLHENALLSEAIVTDILP